MIYLLNVIFSDQFNIDYIFYLNVLSLKVKLKKYFWHMSKNFAHF